tara:strand:- start:110 stop:631 length:522 start_codon:yes stop_codon:yes gene_type:complete
MFLKAFALVSTLCLVVACQSKDASNSANGSDSGAQNGEIGASGPNIWAGPTLTFIKENGADHTDPAHQDAITDNVVLTRGIQGSLMNVIVEDTAKEQSPAGTEWAVGRTEDLQTLEFKPLKAAAKNEMKSVPGMDFVLHLIEEDIYIDVTFLSWNSGGESGGGVGYKRSTQAE